MSSGEEVTTETEGKTHVRTERWWHTRQWQVKAERRWLCTKEWHVAVEKRQPWTKNEKKIFKTTNPTGTLISICSLQNHEKINSCLHHPPYGPQWWVAERTNTASKRKVGAWGCKLYVCSNHQYRAEYRPWKQSFVALSCYRCSQTTNSAKAVNCTANIFIHEHTWK